MKFRTDLFGKVFTGKSPTTHSTQDSVSLAESPTSLDLLGKEYSRLARFGANVLDAHSCFLFLPGITLNDLLNDGPSLVDDTLYMVGAHSLSPAVIEGCSIKSEMGLIGWVCRNGRSIHVSPFERDSRVLGVYREDQQLKSFIGIPIPLSKKNELNLSGVIACDSKKAFAFSKLQGKLLEELGEEASALTSLQLKLTTATQTTQTWESFLARGYELAESVGHNAVEILRVKVSNYSSLEQSMGTGATIRFVEQIFRLIGQALPSHYPTYRCPLGETIIVVDNMMANVYENKILAIASHTAIQGRKVEIEFRSRGFNLRSDGKFDLERLISQTSFVEEPVTNTVTEPMVQSKKILSFR